MQSKIAGLGKKLRRDMKDELLKRLELVEDIGDNRGERVIPDARDISHYKDVLKGIWWYQLATHRLEYSAKAKSHFDVEFTAADRPRGWVRGRVGDDRGKVYAFIYTGDFPTAHLPGYVLSDILRKLQTESGLDIEYFVDEEGYSLVDESR